MDLKSKLHSILKGEVIDNEEHLTLFSKDASIFEIKPKIIVAPQDSEDIKKIIKFVLDNPKENLSITPRAAGTDMSGGAIGEGIILDMTMHFNKILEIGKDYALTQPGVFYRDFEPKTLEKDLLLPCYTASKDLNTLGGMVGNNSAGEKTLLYGQTEKWVESLKVIFADGNEYEVKPLSKTELDKKINQKNYEGQLYKKVFDLIENNYDLIKNAKPKVSKNTAGYYLWNVWDHQIFDLTKLLVGSQGTLGIVTEIKFKLSPVQKHSVLLTISLNNLDKLDEIVNEVLKFNPEAFECFDDQTLNYAVKFMPEIIKHFKHNTGLQGFITFIPELIQKFTKTFPKLVLLASFTGNTPQEAIAKATNATSDLKQFNIKTNLITSEKQAEKYWVIRHESFNMLRHHSTNKRTAPFIDDIIVDPKVLPQFLPKLKKLLANYSDQLTYTIAGHIGDGNFHIIPLVDLADQKTRQDIPEVLEKVFNLVFEYKGSMTAEHNDGLIRGPYLEKMYGEQVYQLFKEVKNIFDPHNIFNPHKKIDATIDYSFKHLAKT